MWARARARACAERKGPHVVAAAEEAARAAAHVDLLLLLLCGHEMGGEESVRARAR